MLIYLAVNSSVTLIHQDQYLYIKLNNILPSRLLFMEQSLWGFDARGYRVVIYMGEASLSIQGKIKGQGNGELTVVMWTKVGNYLPCS